MSTLRTFQSRIWPALILAFSMQTHSAALPGGAQAWVFSGLCDASAMAMLDEHYFVAASDEDNCLRVYRRDQTGPPQFELDLSAFLQTDADAGEADIEGAARLGQTIYWIGSHGANKNGLDRPARRQFFATLLESSGGQPAMRPAGRPYGRLLEDMGHDDRLAGFGLAAASTLAPKHPGALNIEGLCPTPDGRLLIGFRNPVPDGLALVVPLLNPSELPQGHRAKFGDPMRLDLDGLGIRSLEYWDGRYWIVAGPVGGEGLSRLYTWNATSDKPSPAHVDLPSGFNPEAITFYAEEGRPWLWLASDDGTRMFGNMLCKKLADPAQKQFRTLAIPLGTEKTSSLRLGGLGAGN